MLPQAGPVSILSSGMLAILNGSVFVCIYMWIFVCVHVKCMGSIHTCVHIYECHGKRWVSYCVYFPPSSLKVGSLTEPGVRLAVNQPHNILSRPLPLLTQHWGYRCLCSHTQHFLWVLGIRLQSLTLAEQAFPPTEPAPTSTVGFWSLWLVFLPPHQKRIWVPTMFLILQI